MSSHKGYGAIPTEAHEDETDVLVPRTEDDFFDDYYKGGSAKEYATKIPETELARYYGSEDNVLTGLEKVDNVNRRSKCDVRCCRRTIRITRLGFIKGCCCSRDGALMALTMILSIAGTMSNISFFFTFTPLVNAIKDNSPSEFARGMIVVFLALTAVCIFFSLAWYMGQFVALRMRQNMTRAIHFRYLSDNTYYRLINMDKRIDNPDQRIVEDCRMFCNNLMAFMAGTSAFTNGIFGTILSIIILGVMAFNAVGPIPWVSSFAFMIIGFLVVKLFLNLVVPLIFRQDRCEGDFRFGHIHLREHAESVAFYSGQDQQHSYVNFELRKALKNYIKLTIRRLWLDLANFILQNVASTLNMFVPAVTLFVLGGSLPGGVPFSDAFAYFSGFLGDTSNLLNTIDFVTNIAGYANRLGEFLEVLDDIEAQQKMHVYQVPCSTEVAVAGTFRAADRLELDGVTCQTPDNIELLRDVSFTLEFGQSLLIMGPSGIGKSSLLRVIGALWPIRGSGVVTRPATVGHNGLFYLPQRAYLVLNGSLRAQIAYPLSPKDVSGNISDVELASLLDYFKLTHLIDIDRAAGEGTVEWDNILSGGEKQRLSMARLFFHKPRFAILDECTAACDEEIEDRFYNRLRESGIGYVSVAHASRVKHHHQRVMLLNPRGGYELLPASAVPDKIKWNEVFRTESLDMPLALGAKDAEITMEEGLARPVVSGDYDHMPTVYHPVTEEAVVNQEPVEAVASEVRKRKESGMDVPKEEAIDAYWVDQTKEHRKKILERVIEEDQAGKRAALNIRFLKRVGRLRRIIFGGFCSSATGLLILTIFFTWLKAAAQVYTPTLIQELSHDALDITARTAFYTKIVVMLVVLVLKAFAQALMFYTAGRLVVVLRRQLTRYIHYRYLHGLAFYQAVCIDKRIDNPDQRITHDCREFVTSLISLLFGTLIRIGIIEIVPELIALTIFSYNTVEWYGLVMAYGFAIISAIANRFLAAPIVPLTFRRDRLEGDFRFAHARLRTHSESVSFLSGARQEHHLVNSLMARAIANERILIFKHFLVNVYQCFVNYQPTWGGFLLAGLVFFNGGWSGGVADVTVNFLAVYIQYQYLFTCIANIFEMVDAFATFAGEANRLGDFLEILDDYQDQALRPTALNGPDIALDHVSVSTPDGKQLTRDLSLAVHERESLIITGPSGVGKSSVLRTIAGLWRAEAGRVFRPSKVGRDGVFFLPQAPLLILGTLKEQVVYPNKIADVHLSDDELRERLREFRLEHLMDRVYASGNAAEAQAHQAHWDDLLSGGEKQRIAMVRLFYNQPRFVFLDECTSACDEEIEEVFYTKLRESGIGFVSVAHRDTVRRFHETNLQLARDGTWFIEPMRF